MPNQFCQLFRFNYPCKFTQCPIIRHDTGYKMTLISCVRIQPTLSPNNTLSSRRKAGTRTW